MNVSLLYILSFLTLPFLWAASAYKYNDLDTKNYDEMKAIVSSYINSANEIDQANQVEAEANGQVDYDDSASIAELEKALKIILSRPNKDNMLSKLLPRLRTQLNNYGAYYASLSNIVIEAVNSMNQKIPVVYKSTYIFILNNIMSEHRPEIKRNSEVKKIFVQIRDANISVPQKVRLDRKLRSMYKSDSPSETAGKILKKAFPNEDPKKKKSFWRRLFG